jgi:hypothetical protein
MAREGSFNALKHFVVFVCGFLLALTQTTRQIKSQQSSVCRGEATRKAIGNLSVRLDIESDNELIRLRGPKVSMQDAVEIMNQYMEANQIREVPVDAEDEGTLLAGGDESVIRKLQDQLGVEVHIHRSDHIARIRGERSKVDEAAVRISRVRGFSRL